MDGLTIKVTNFSDTVWKRSEWKAGAGQSEELNWTDEVTQTPATQLEAFDGGTTAAAHSEHMTTIAHDALWIRLGYECDGAKFAVAVQQRFHMFGVGPQDQWSYLDPTSGSWIDWTTDTTPQLWKLGKYEVFAQPVLENLAASVDIIIKKSK